MKKWTAFSLIQIFALAATAQGNTDLVKSSSGRAPSPELKMKSSKVPQFELIQKKVVKGKTEMVRVSNIPRLDIGEEPEIKAQNIAGEAFSPGREVKQFTIKKLPTPPPSQVPRIQFQLRAARDAKVFANNVNPTQVPPAPQTPPAPSIMLSPEPKSGQIPLIEMPPSEMKLLQALIFLEIKKNYPMALALFAEMQEEDKYKVEATYHLAVTSKGLGLYSEYKYHMQQVLNVKDPFWQKAAARSLARSAAPGDTELVPILDPIIAALDLDIANSDQYQINRAKYYLEKNDLTNSFSAVEEIEVTSKLYTEALFLKSLILYRGGQLAESEVLQKAVLKELDEKQPKSEFRTIVILTLARLMFQEAKYKEAFQEYLKVEKQHPEWLQAMVEQAWTQILASDFEGAAGNMFSLHTDFFKKAFIPESYVARTVGYLNLCQYGDGGRVIYDFKKRYGPLVPVLRQYEAKMKEPVNYYDTVKTWAKNPDLKTVEGLPREFIFALTRHPHFALRQKNINDIEDQVGRINKINLDLIKSERESLSAQKDAQKKLAELRKSAKGQTTPEIDYQNKRLMSAKIEYYIAKKARNSIKDLRAQGMERLEKDKAHVRDLAGLAVKAQFGQMLKRLTETLDQAEVLQYELYSGAGEHLRYQLAGGDVNPKERPELKVEKEKALNWEFRGEIWEDELGHYRSSLKNVCPPDDPMDKGSSAVAPAAAKPPKK
jgi:hypothetical protein